MSALQGRIFRRSSDPATRGSFVVELEGEWIRRTLRVRLSTQAAQMVLEWREDSEREWKRAELLHFSRPAQPGESEEELLRAVRELVHSLCGQVRWRGIDHDLPPVRTEVSALN